MTVSRQICARGIPQQLELGVLPIEKKITEGMIVAFFVVICGNKGRRSKKKVTHIGRVVSVEYKNVIIADILSPGSRFNRPAEKIFEVHKDTSLWMWTQ